MKVKVYKEFELKLTEEEKGLLSELVANEFTSKMKEKNIKYLYFLETLWKKIDHSKWRIESGE